MEVAWKGLAVGCRFFSMLGAMGIPCYVLNPTIRTVSIERGHVSPMELVQDRYRSHTLNVLLAAALVTGLIIGCGAQLLAMKTMLQAITNDHDEAYWGTVFVAGVAMFCEFCGGFRGIARIDHVNTYTTMFITFLATSLVVSQWGGLEDLGPARCQNGWPSSQGSLNEFQESTLMCKMNTTGSPCLSGCAVTCGRWTPIGCDAMGNMSAASHPNVIDHPWVLNWGLIPQRSTPVTAVNGSGNSTCSFCDRWKSMCGGCYGDAWIFEDDSLARRGITAGSSTPGTGTVDTAALVRHPHAWQGDFGVWKTFGLVFMVASGGHGGSMAPHIFQRVVSADSDRTLKKSLVPLFPAGFLTLLAGLVFGVTW